ncbi:MAG: response regulator [Deltaproteobacteria bacterium]|nr:response regulator [Deltaproteobacteria bacterium]
MSDRMKWAIVGLVTAVFVSLLWILVPLVGPTVNVLCMAAPVVATLFFGFGPGLLVLFANWGISCVVMLYVPGMELVEPPTRAIPPFVASILLVYGVNRIRAYIIDRNNIESMLRASENRYKMIFRQSGEGILLLDATGQVLEANPAVTEHTGISSVDFPGKNVLDSLTFLGEKPADFNAMIREAQSSKGEYERIVQHGAGTKIYLQLWFSSADVREDGIKWICHLRNVSEKKEVLEIQQDAKKMEAIGRLAGGVAHDLNNILNAIVGSAHAHQTEHAQCDIGFEDIENISAACKRGAQLTGSLLGFTRKSNLSKELFSLNQSVLNILATASKTSSKDIKYENRLEPNLPQIEGDQNQIEAALMNICLNAHDAMESGGSLTVTSYSDSDGVWIHVQDSGEGMDEDTRQRAFEPFFTTKPVGQGTGLGLAMAYGVMQSHGGKIHLQSAVGKGTTVTLWFPKANVNLKMRKIDAQQGAEMDVSILVGHTILLVDDEPIVLRAGVRMLKTLGCNVVSATGGEDAIAIFETNDRITLVLLDLIMPGLDGAATLTRLRQIRPSVPIILVSGYTRNIERVRDFQQEGEVAFIPKPYSPSDLAKALRNIFPT